MKKTFEIGFWILAVLNACWWVILYATSSIPLSEFDGALRMLAHTYAKHGFIPYKEFGVVYPPGMFLLIGKIIPFTSIGERNFIVTVITVILLLACIFLLRRCFSSSWVDARLSVLILFSPIVLSQIYGDPFSFLFITLLALTQFTYLQKKCKDTSAYILLGTIGFLSPFFRWDWVLFYLGVVGVFTTIAAIFHLYQRSTIRDMWKTLAVMCLGMVVGLYSMVLYFSFLGVQSEAYAFIFKLPTQVILEYRKLPLPHLQKPRGLNSLIYLSVLVYMYVIVKNISTWRKIRHLYLFFLLPLSVFPYAIGRADWPHALPFAYTIILLILMTYAYTRQKLLYTFILFIYLGACVRILMPPRILPRFNPSGLDRELSEQLQSCAEQTQGLSAASLFVGRASYRRFLINAASLYLLRPTVKSATSYISDEPGLQNSCLYGEKIAQDLQHSSKPMLTFLELGEQKTEPNKTATMESCGKIETALSTLPHIVIGTCFAYNREFEVRFYQ